MTTSNQQASSGSASDSIPIRNGADGSSIQTQNKKRPYSSVIENGDDSGSTKFDAILNTVVDTQKINLKQIEEWLREKLKTHSFSHYDLMTDLIVDYIQREQYPDPRVLQCEIADYKLLSQDEVKQLIKRVWSYLCQQQEALHKAKQRKVSDSTSSTSKLSTSTETRHCASNQRYYSQSVDQCR